MDNPNHPSAQNVPVADLGRAIRRLRHERGLTIETLAFASSTHPTYVSGIERGRRNPTWNVLCALTQALELPLIELVREAEVEAQLAQRIAEARRELGMAA